jgi:hypothetical protein
MSWLDGQLRKISSLEQELSRVKVELSRKPNDEMLLRKWQRLEEQIRYERYNYESKNRDRKNY